jgi:para-aminobenzoate synthetase component 1
MTNPVPSHVDAVEPVRPARLDHQWIARTWITPSGCLVAEATAGVDPVTVFRHASQLPHAIFFDSAVIDRPAAATAAAAPANDPPVRLGRYSFVAADPIRSWLVRRGGDWDACRREIAATFAVIREVLADLACLTIPALPPFQGGVAGLVSYDCGLARLGLEPPPAASPDPVLSLHVYDVVFAYDHDLGRGWFISQGVPARGPLERQRRAAERLAIFIAGCPRPAADTAREPQPPASAVPAWAAHPLAGHAGVFTSQSPETYRQMVARGIDYVRAGDIFQVNLAQQFAVAGAVDPVELSMRAREINAAPFASFFDAGDVQIVSMSPERFLQAARGSVRMHPIKGTRRMIASPEADLFAGDDLEASAKDRAENVMIVDLVRNDLARVCRPESVRVEALCRLERYRYVQHLVSIVAGRLRPGLSAVDALEAAIPGGSVTGAPKHRACEIISELEGVARGAYCGSLGYIGLDGTADFNLLIRTIVASPSGLTFAAGGGITAASDPAAEHAESLHKAEGMLRVLAAMPSRQPGVPSRPPVAEPTA